MQLKANCLGRTNGSGFANQFGALGNDHMCGHEGQPVVGSWLLAREPSYRGDATANDGIEPPKHADDDKQQNAIEKARLE